jgi:SAM-dependent methyltransferase
VHATAYAHMELCIETYMRKDRHYRILDLGSRKSGARHATHRPLLAAYDHEYVGADVAPGGNVDVVMKKPYRIPVKSNSFDVVMTNQVFEHVAFPWALFLEMCRIVKPGGLIFLIAPSRGQQHGKIDCWRYYPDSMRSFAAVGRMQLLEMYVDLPPNRKAVPRPDYAALANNWWGDGVGVFRKPEHYSKLVHVVREVNVWWANRVRRIDHIRPPRPLPERRLIGPRFTRQQLPE